MDDTRTPHPADEFLENAGLPPADARLREKLRTRTAGMVRRQRWMRRVRRVAALAACYLAGVLSMWYATPAREPPAPEIANYPAPLTAADTPGPTQVAAAPVQESVLDLEWRAFEATEQRAELYRLAGDRYLDQKDLASALRCYRQALNATPQEKLAIAAGDSWLLMALKESRQKEKTHARNDG